METYAIIILKSSVKQKTNSSCICLKLLALSVYRKFFECATVLKITQAEVEQQRQETLLSITIVETLLSSSGSAFVDSEDS